MTSLSFGAELEKDSEKTFRILPPSESERRVLSEYGINLHKPRKRMEIHKGMVHKYASHVFLMVLK